MVLDREAEQSKHHRREAPAQRRRSAAAAIRSVSLMPGWPWQSGSTRALQTPLLPRVASSLFGLWS